MKQVTQNPYTVNRKPYTRRIVALLLAQSFLLSSIWPALAENRSRPGPAWASPSDFLRPRPASKTLGEELERATEGKEARDGGEGKELPYGRRGPLDKNIARQIPLLTPQTEAWNQLLSSLPRLKAAPIFQQRVITTFSAVAWNIDAWIEAREVTKAHRGLRMGQELEFRLRHSAHGQFERTTRGRKLSDDEAREAWRELDQNRQLAFRVLMTSTELQEKGDQLILRLNIGIEERPILIDLHIFPLHVAPLLQGPVLIRSRISSDVKQEYSFELVTTNMGDQRREWLTSSGSAAGDGATKDWGHPNYSRVTEFQNSTFLTPDERVLLEYYLEKKAPVNPARASVRIDFPEGKKSVQEIEALIRTLREKGIPVIPTRRRYPKKEESDALEIVKAVFEQRAAKKMESHTGALQKGKGTDQALFEIARELEAKHQKEIIPRVRHKPMATLEAWQNFILKKIVNGEAITGEKIRRERITDVSKLMRLEETHGLQLVLRRKSSRKGFSEFSAKVAKLLWNRFSPENQSLWEESAAEITQALREGTWEEQLALLSLLNRHHLLGYRTAFFLETEDGQTFLHLFKPHIFNEDIPRMIRWADPSDHGESARRILAWLTLMPESYGEIRKKIEKDETLGWKGIHKGKKLRDLWPAFQKTPLGWEITEALKEAKELVEKKKKLPLGDERRLVALLETGEASDSKAAEVLGYRRYGDLDRLARILWVKGIQISRDSITGNLKMISALSAASSGEPVEKIKRFERGETIYGLHGPVVVISDRNDPQWGRRVVAKPKIGPPITYLGPSAAHLSRKPIEWRKKLAEGKFPGRAKDGANRQFAPIPLSSSLHHPSKDPLLISP